ncbi:MULTISPECIES: ABC transporter ATP-binding protein [Metabacillus]|uniref:ABC transporter ATP-binding protein n=1 Tax=Metabacillus hrfriensis TaxID=3048891 RepID=A0ACD4RFL3_9BACI|nr:MULTISPECIES: ABC transporter ATP-binding protein [Metabacillus]UAL53747.1 ABC transporter ATP-binding protein [Metabacillus dongyingensis]UOK59173.1 ABC transporter ATP-binding protein [Bacillus sp. OVS6]WHZ59301.1 ABC transporter ATP-binding protein [Metabacillus sp. CT-WN-B3]
MIRFENVSKVYKDGTKAVNALDLTIEKGEFFVFIGPSGCGKTTTMKMINRLIDATAGSVFIDGKNVHDYDIHELRWNIGYVLQQIALFPHMTIEENIAIVPELRKWDAEKIRKRTDVLLEMVGLDPDTYRTRKPSELSGGQQQRIGVIRALAADPDIILMDEPFSALDPISREKLQQDMIDLQKRIHKTIVFVTHDMQEALALGDRICVMKDGEVIQVDTPEAIVRDPANEFVKEFIGHRAVTNVLEGSIEGFVRPLQETDPLKVPLSYSADIKVALARLGEEDMIPVERNGQIIGTITRESAVQFLSGRTEERG